MVFFSAASAFPRNTAKTRSITNGLNLFIVITILRITLSTVWRLSSMAQHAVLVLHDRGGK